MGQRFSGRGGSRRPPRAVGAVGTLVCVLALASCDLPVANPPVLIADNADGSARVEVPICVGDDLRDISVSEDPEDASRGGNLDFNGLESFRKTDGTVSFDLGPALLEAKSAGGLPAGEGTPFRRRPLTYHDLGMVWVTTGKTLAWFRIRDLPAGAGEAWLVSGDVTDQARAATTPAEGEAILNAWCADQRASASGK